MLTYNVSNPIKGRMRVHLQVFGVLLAVGVACNLAASFMAILVQLILAFISARIDAHRHQHSQQYNRRSCMSLALNHWKQISSPWAFGFWLLFTISQILTHALTLPCALESCDDTSESQWCNSIIWGSTDFIQFLLRTKRHVTMHVYMALVVCQVLVSDRCAVVLIHLHFDSDYSTLSQDEEGSAADELPIVTVSADKVSSTQQLLSANSDAQLSEDRPTANIESVRATETVSVATQSNPVNVSVTLPPPPHPSSNDTVGLQATTVEAMVQQFTPQTEQAVSAPITLQIPSASTSTARPNYSANRRVPRQALQFG